MLHVRKRIMKLKLHRTNKNEHGVFGELLDENNRRIAVTLEHSYDSGHGDGSYSSKIPNGTYACNRGQHRLEHMTKPFETFEIEKVPGHFDILFHTGNYNQDSNGCVLLGTSIIDTGKIHMITKSKAAFDQFMNKLKGINSFTLIVT